MDEVQTMAGCNASSALLRRSDNKPTPISAVLPLAALAWWEGCLPAPARRKPIGSRIWPRSGRARATKLIGYGLVVGLAAAATRVRQAHPAKLTNMLSQLGVRCPPAAACR